jgi:transposase
MGTPIPATQPAATAAKDDPTIWCVDDALWAKLEPVLRIDKPRKKPGRPRRDNRAIFDGLIWLARTGSHWSQLPARFGPKSTVHLRFTEWVATGALERAWALLLREYDGAIGIDWTWQAADGCIVKAPFGKKGALARRRRPAVTPPIAANPAPSATF